jgi:hypothetical protein
MRIVRVVRWGVVDLRKETAMTATKAVAGGVAANIVTIILWMLTNIPGWQAVPDQPKAAIIALVSAGVGAAIVYLAPQNKRTVKAPATGTDAAFRASLEAGSILVGAPNN